MFRRLSAVQVLKAAIKLADHTLSMRSGYRQGLLDRDVSRRLTAVQALEHPWVRPGGTAPDRPLEGTVVRLLQRRSSSVVS